MTLQQLRCFHEVVAQGLNLSRAARTMHTSQSAVSKMMRALELELGFDLLLRAGPRVVGITDSAKPILEQARQVLNAVHNLKLTASDCKDSESGEMRIVTTHVHVRYALVDIITRLGARYPQVNVDIAEATPGDIAEQLLTGRADIGISAMANTLPPQLFRIAAYPLKRCLIVQPGHPLLGVKRKITLKDIAGYPLVLTRGHTGAAVDRVFRQANAPTRVRIRVPSVDAAKTYVAAGLGIAVTHEMTLSRDDKSIRRIDVDHLFPPPTVWIVLRRDQYFRKFLYDFIEMLNSRWNHESVDRMRKSRKSANQA